MANLRYNSTRGQELNLTASWAILKGLADDGGLFMPNEIPKFDFDLSNLKTKSYQEIAYEVMKLFFTDYSPDELKYCIENAYDDKFDDENIAPITKLNSSYYLELFHGSTIAFKDMALSILPYLLKVAAKKNNINDKIVILTATSGDTGKAALAGFSDVSQTEIIVFYPKNGVSKIQELQMLTQAGNNTNVVAINGNFDAAQAGVKKIFEDEEFKKQLKEKNILLSSANSINIGRLVPQIVYYVYAYLKLLENNEIKEGEKINICVPTGNFGNILAAYFAKKMGLNIDKLIVASNENNVLFDFFNRGTYDKNREFILTNSPSMDILISSNLERLIYLANDCNYDINTKLMQQLKDTGKYQISAEAKENIKDFICGYASENETCEQIKKVYENTNYIIDTHTAVASYVCEKYKKDTKDDTKTLIVATASPYKFANSVVESIIGKNTYNEWELIDKLNELSKVKIPKAIEELKNAKILHTKECEAKDMKNIVEKILNL